MSKKWYSLYICAIFFITSFSIASSDNYNIVKSFDEIETSSYIIINSDDVPNIASMLRSEGFDVLYGSETKTSLELIVTSGELRLLKERGFKPVILSHGRPFVEIQEEQLENLPSSIVPLGYPDLAKIIDEMYDIENSYPSICKVVDLTEKYGVSPTYENRHIYAIKISDKVNLDEDEPSFLMVSCHHAREIVTPVIALYAIEQLSTEYDNDPNITSVVNDYEIWISPVWNPDGYEYCYYYDNWWRKNRHPYPPGVGVDLNRNYPFGWNSWCSGSTDPNSETYKGPSPASEAETQTMIAFSDDKYFTKVIDYHSYGREVLYGYSCHLHPFSNFFYSEAVDLSNVAGYGGSVREPSAEGENYEWQIWTNGSYANLMETHNDFQPSYSSALSEAEQIWPSTMWLLERPISVSGHIVDSLTGEPLVTSIDILDVNFSNSEKFINEPSYGRYHLFLPPGTYTLEFSYENYHSQAHEVSVTTKSAEILDVELVRLNKPPNKPSITGPEIGKEGEEYEFIFKATDPDLDDLKYYIKWGDGHIEPWIGPYNSGDEVKISHKWNIQGTYMIEVKVKDVYEEESNWEDFLITIEKRSKNLFQQRLQFIKQYFLRFLIF